MYTKELCIFKILFLFVWGREEGIRGCLFRGQNRDSDPLDLELEFTGGCKLRDVYANWTRIFWKRGKHSWWQSHLLFPVNSLSNLQSVIYSHVCRAAQSPHRCFLECPEMPSLIFKSPPPCGPPRMPRKGRAHDAEKVLCLDSTSKSPLQRTEHSTGSPLCGFGIHRPGHFTGESDTQTRSECYWFWSWEVRVPVSDLRHLHPAQAFPF